MLFGSFVGAVDAGPASSPYPRSRHAAQHHVTLPTSDPNGIVNVDDAIVVIESDGQHSCRQHPLIVPALSRIKWRQASARD